VDLDSRVAMVPVVTVALETGLRKGELLGLEWDRVDLSRGVLRLEVTKSGKRREVPMRQAVYTTLAGLPEPHEGRVWRTGSVRKAFENAVTGVKLEDFHFHDLRHTFASTYVMRGGSLPALQQILGHATLAMTMRYSHLSPRHLRDEMEKTDTATAVPTELTNPRAQARAHEPVEGVVLLDK
jgi:integrase/recombinase XerD